MNVSYVGMYRPREAREIGILRRASRHFRATHFFMVDGTDPVPESPEIINLRDLDSMLGRYRALHPDIQFVGIETGPRAVPLHDFTHPMQAVYLTGSQNAGLPRDVMDSLDAIVCVEAPSLLDVGVAGAIVLQDRFVNLGGRE